MALSSGECLYPRWRLKAEVFWPASTMAQSTKLAKAALDGGLIERAEAKADEDGFTGDEADTAARWYVGYLAAQGRLDQMVGLPSDVDVRDEGSSGYTADQRALMAALRDEFLGEYQDLVDGTVAEGEAPFPRTSRSVRAEFEIV